MAAPSPIAKVSVGKSGYGSAHTAYITRMSALDPQGRESGKSADQRAEQPSLIASHDAGMREAIVKETLEDTLSERSLAGGKEHGGAEQSRSDPIWTWNAPPFLTGDSGGTRSDLEPERAESGGRFGGVGDRDKLTLKEKVQNIKDYFGSLEDYERRKGG